MRLVHCPLPARCCALLKNNGPGGLISVKAPVSCGVWQSTGQINYVFCNDQIFILNVLSNWLQWNMLGRVHQKMNWTGRAERLVHFQKWYLTSRNMLFIHFFPPWFILTAAHEALCCFAEVVLDPHLLERESTVTVFFRIAVWFSRRSPGRSKVSAKAGTRLGLNGQTGLRAGGLETTISDWSKLLFYLRNTRHHPTWQL